MPVGANLRIDLTPTDPAAAPPAAAGSVEELFAQLIASLGEAGPSAELSESAAEAPITTTPGSVDAMAEQLLSLTTRQAEGELSSILPDEVFMDGQQPAAANTVALSAAVEQLLALVSRKPGASLGSGKEEALEETPTDEGDAATPRSLGKEADVSILPTALPIDARPITSPATGLSQASAPAEEGLTIVPFAQPLATTADAAAAAEPAVAPAAQLASSRTDAAVQQAFSSLQAVVKDLPPQFWAAAIAKPSGLTGDQDKSPAGQDVKPGALNIVSTINAAFAPFEAPRAANNVEAAAQAPQIDPSQLSVEHQLNMEHEGEWLDRLARDIAQTAGTDKNPLRFRLNPETLGTLRVEITQDRHGAAVRMTADTEAARSIIADAQPRLIAEARAQGIRISEAHVDLGNQTASGDPRRQNVPFEEPQLRTARSLQEEVDGDGKPTPDRSERYA